MDWIKHNSAAYKLGDDVVFVRGGGVWEVGKFDKSSVSESIVSQGDRFGSLEEAKRFVEKLKS